MFQVEIREAFVYTIWHNRKILAEPPRLLTILIQSSLIYTPQIKAANYQKGPIFFKIPVFLPTQ